MFQPVRYRVLFRVRHVVMHLMLMQPQNQETVLKIGKIMMVIQLMKRIN